MLSSITAPCRWCCKGGGGGGGEGEGGGGEGANLALRAATAAAAFWYVSGVPSQLRTLPPSLALVLIGRMYAPVDDDLRSAASASAGLFPGDPNPNLL